ncbi:hypothetical protein DICPUDRAFT_38457 [Dictyostelium purpureum]|uniref:Methyltransferase type 11 domain-containing protein n=1 Tax=Dictyostelium purpureum TaxID=5786 RepID=F0ZUI2_DICPU|nr:uncharacterized protein DICPUDRAFT_38457 [Dictyostelium purpureum]EGC32397.1 hypothetical protein DICPUDRAFT_38457 [Dictyostelium purpureum]|eukprot:XP_003291083.1 hypothetical protein DICPUDRAFT_38457 [Dictyostelium purpureum]
MSTPTKIFSTEELEVKWDKFSKTFQFYNEPTTLPVSMLLMGNIGLTHPNNKIKSIVEVACGAGASTELALFLKKNETKFLACDLSQEMLALARDRLGMKQNEDEIKSKNFTLKQGDAEHLPIEDSSVDRYFANYCLHLVNDPDQMLRDSYRVLEKGGIAAFSVWGRSQNSNQFAIVGIVAKELGIQLADSGARTPYHLGDTTKLRKMALDAGFQRVQAGYTFFNQIISNGVDYANIFLSTPDAKVTLERIGAEKEAILRSKVAEYVDNLISNGEMIGLDIAYIVCFKD